MSPWLIWLDARDQGGKLINEDVSVASSFWSRT